MKGSQMALLGGWVLRIGALSLLLAAWRLERRALELGLAARHLIWLIPLALAAGWIKARMVMRKRMLHNARRLWTSTGRLAPWQLYPPQLLIFILTMVILMSWLKHHFQVDPLALAILGAVDLAIAAALLASARVYQEARPR